MLLKYYMVVLWNTLYNKDICKDICIMTNSKGIIFYFTKIKIPFY